jgi:shikimate kinase
MELQQFAIPSHRMNWCDFLLFDGLRSSTSNRSMRARIPRFKSHRDFPQAETSVKSDSRIFLVGPMGAGKTTIGRRLAKRLRRKFVDADQELERRTGASVALIFDVEGESGFRSREKRIIDELTQIDDIVLATGGGSVLDPDNRAALSSRGFVVYLHARLEDLIERTQRDSNRPLLNTDDPKARMRELLEYRDPIYRQVADLTVDTGSLNLTEVVREIRMARP